MRTSDLLFQMREAAIADVKLLEDLARERQNLADAHRRYLANVQSAQMLADGLRGIEAFVGKEQFKQWGQQIEGWADAHIDDPDPREHAGIWEHLEIVLRFSTELRMYELLVALRDVGIAVTRPAIESAVRTHHKRFNVRRRGRDRLVSLKPTAGVGL